MPSQGSMRRSFPMISPHAFEHPLDRAALERLEKVPLLNQVLKTINGLVAERSVRLLYQAQSVQVSADQLSHLHKILIDCVRILDLPEVPELFVTQNPVVNAGVFGATRPIIIMNSASLELFTSDELRFMLGHELGHILSNHVLYKTLVKTALKLTLPLLTRLGLPVAGIALQSLLMALLEWDRKSELSADRAALLCVQNPDVGYRVLMKTAGGVIGTELNVEAFVAQAEAYEKTPDSSEAVLKLLHLLGGSHPFPVTRVSHLKKWVDSGAYQAILDGHFELRTARSEGMERPLEDDTPDGSSLGEQRLSGLFNAIGETIGAARQNLEARVKTMMHQDSHDLDTKD
ncbi:MAG: M48 family metallopeptidase [Myxococcota bacterium]|nr:M48 family metallopeptidase [Myxococcota bacterium]